jgi:hypothetical protein
MSSRIIYRLVDFSKIKKDGFSYSLPQETLDIIKKIATSVGAPEYIKTPQFEKRNHKTNKYHHNNNHSTPPIKDITIENWNASRNFTATVMEKKKGIELSVDKIRKSLNKITDKTYDKMVAQIIEEIDLILKEHGSFENGNNIETDEFKKEVKRIGDSIFDIASGNGFYSKMYAKMSKALMDKYEFMNDIFKNKINNDTYLFSDYAFCSPDSDYDQFCKNNKLNEKRRALGLFYINLMMEGIVKEDNIIKMIEDIQHKLLEEIAKENNSNIAEEMSEFIYIMIINGETTLKKSDANVNGKWGEIIERVKVIAVKKHKSDPSITNKTIFKHMDILNAVNKK